VLSAGSARNSRVEAVADGSISLTNPTPSEVTLDASAPADFVAAVNAAAPEEH